MASPTDAGLAGRLVLLIPTVLSLTVHEWAHAATATRLGDDTALRQGRLTLNPLAHIDPLGTVLLPLLGIPFGWARPVPTNPTRFTRRLSMRTGSMLVAIAGPLSNALLALLCAVLFGLAHRFEPELVAHGAGVGELLWDGLKVNVALAIFNALPIPPLDGHWVVEAFVPPRLERLWFQFKAMGSVVLFGVVVAGGRFLGAPTAYLIDALVQLIYLVGG